MYILILAGGLGTRLWPVSRKNKPKQISEIFSAQDGSVFGGETMIEKTWKRLRARYPAKNLFICTDRKSAAFIRKNITGVLTSNLLIEPFPRGTSAAIYYGASVIAARHGDAPFAVITSDAYIRDNGKYLRILEKMETLLRKYPEKTVLVGVKPAYAETGYGYIKIKRKMPRSRASSLRGRRHVKRKTKENIFDVEKFIEKPTLAKARAYVKSGQYFWNPGIFGWTTNQLQKLYRKYLPHTYRAFANFSAASPKSVLGDRYDKADNISIDYGILEKEKNMLVLPADFFWADMGHWRTVHEILRGAPDENVVKGKHVSLDSAGNLIYSASGKLIATAGLHDTVIIETSDAILVCPRDHAQDVKQLTQLLKKQGLTKYL